MKPGLATSSRVYQPSSSSAAQSGLLKKASQVHQMEKSAAEGAARLSDEASVALGEGQTRKLLNEWIPKYPEVLRNYKGRTIKEFSQLTYEDSARHIFSIKHITNGIDTFGTSRQSILDSVAKIILEQDYLGRLMEGGNQIHLKISGQNAVIRLHISDGEVKSFNLFKGKTSKIIGNLINI